MLPGIRGRLVSTYFASQLLETAFAGRLGERDRQAAQRRLATWWTRCEQVLGPASSLRAMYDVAVAPLAALLSFTPGRVVSVPPRPFLLAPLDGPSAARVALVIAPWDADLGLTWRDARIHAAFDVRWAFGFNGRTLRVIDAGRPYAGRFQEFDLDIVAGADRSFAVFWALVQARAFAPSPGAGSAPEGCLLDAVIDASARHASGVCRSLRDGVLEALAELAESLLTAGTPRHRPAAARTGPDLEATVEQALTIVYRILFLLFAEARGLVPNWHPTYRDGYTIETLRDIAEAPGPAGGLWESLQAITRLAAVGCRHGDLIVTAFNGRLFSPARTPLAESLALDDERVRRALAALSSRPQAGCGRRERIAYRDLGVEQLGAVYESVLDYTPRRLEPPLPQPRGAGDDSPRVRFERTGSRRKTTGSFYTPRSITDYLVRHALAPLVQDRDPDAILRLRVVDPAMGSGAFLVAACRYLAQAYETALLRRGDCQAGDLGPPERAGFRRTVAQRCLFGVDANPTAVQLARLSMWLATLAADKPLTFLDHHFVTGDSLIGASPDDLARQPPGARGRPAVLPLFESGLAGAAVREALPIRQSLSSIPDDSVALVRQKERALERLEDPAAALARWKAAADLWCAVWFMTDGPPPAPGLFAELTAALLDGRSALPDDVTSSWHARLRTIAARHRFLHWSLQFPEIFFDDDGQPAADGGFDAVLGNPPWDMLRADSGGSEDRRRDRADLARTLRFIRASGIYHAQSSGQPNLYQLFVERALRLARPGGRVGLVVPSGLFTDHGSAPLRRRLLEQNDIDAVVGLDNRAGVFPIHRSTSFLLLTATTGTPTERMACRFHETDPGLLDAVPESPAPAGRASGAIVLTPATIRRIGGPSLTIPLLAGPVDLAITDRIANAFPALSDQHGWGVRFGRELNATDDRAHFHRDAGGLPVVEGRQIEPFAVNLAASRFHIRRADAARLIDGTDSFDRERLAYRDVAGATNRLTLIAAILPAGCVTTHTIFCVKSKLEADAQAFLCGLLNSLVLNYLVRQRITMHVTTAVLHALPAPKPLRTSRAFRDVVRLAGELRARPDAGAPLVRLQARVARLYRLDRAELAHILSTFPLLAREYRDAVLAAHGDPPEP